MADMKTGIFAKNVQKRLNRAQEKVRFGAGELLGRGRGARMMRRRCPGMQLRSPPAPAAAASPLFTRGGAGRGPVPPALLRNCPISPRCPLPPPAARGLRALPTVPAAAGTGRRSLALAAAGAARGGGTAPQPGRPRFPWPARGMRAWFASPRRQPS